MPIPPAMMAFLTFGARVAPPRSSETRVVGVGSVAGSGRVAVPAELGVPAESGVSDIVDLAFVARTRVCAES